jgi:hypothetical protein
MEVLETREEVESSKTKRQREDEVAREMQAALSAASKRVEERHAGDDAKPLEDERTVADVKAHVEESPSLSGISRSMEAASTNVIDPKREERKVEVTKAEKEAFINSVVTGDRYRESVSLMGGALSVTFRSRSSIESEAIDSLLRKRVTSGEIASSTEFAEAMKFCILSACVESVNGVKNPTLTEAADGKNGLFHFADKDGINPPKWLWLYDQWRDKPEFFAASIIEAYFDFEAKYWVMIKNAKDENFRNAGRSTGG